MTWPSGDPNQPPAYGPEGGQYQPPPPPMPYQQGPYQHEPYQQGPYQHEPYQQGPYGQGQYGQPQPGYPYPAPYPTPKKSRRGLIIGLSVLAVVLLGGLGAAVAVFSFVTKDKVIATDLAVGDCITDIPKGALVQLVPKTDCAQPHSGEVYAVLAMPDGEYPGQATIDDWQNKCPGELQSYSADAMADDSIGVFVLYPTSETWAQGDREIVCMATTDDKRSGSIKS